VSGLLGASVVESVWPVATVALGWIGVIVGMQFRLPELVRIPGVTYRLAFAESLTTLALVAAACGAAIVAVFGLAPHEALVPARSATYGSASSRRRAWPSGSRRSWPKCIRSAARSSARCSSP
jgi:hypothetical protein